VKKQEEESKDLSVIDTEIDNAIKDIANLLNYGYYNVDGSKVFEYDI
jgi:hypothetical protein